MATNFGLTTTVAVTPHALDLLERASELSGLPRGKLASLAIEALYDPKKNRRFAEAQDAARSAFVDKVLT